MLDVCDSWNLFVHGVRWFYHLMRVALQTWCMWLAWHWGLVHTSWKILCAQLLRRVLKFEFVALSPTHVSTRSKCNAHVCFEWSLGWGPFDPVEHLPMKVIRLVSGGHLRVSLGLELRSQVRENDRSAARFLWIINLQVLQTLRINFSGFSNFLESNLMVGTLSRSIVVADSLTLSRGWALQEFLTPRPLGSSGRRTMQTWASSSIVSHYIDAALWASVWLSELKPF